MLWKKLDRIEKKISGILKINDGIPAWVLMIIYWLLGAVTIFIGAKIVSVMPGILHDLLTGVFSAAAVLCIFSAMWQFGQIFEGRSFCKMIHRIIIIVFFAALFAVLIIMISYLDAKCGCKN